ncbi:flagellar basal body L-ring protein FlgH [Frateuria edaphi]|uniref:flagellar basal body L-ring protein FlgH n=1 Tax=Frateuria edaphi TaxID=2898793 RepID=UPI001E466482|nr:flagellar basal body L-ring protein FlgH [Frateuria edaphi]UGB46344.1 flagellar basal body L-ring protein FlgH [Frateuria edaphi]
MSLFRLSTAALALALLAGCMAMPARDDGEWAPTPPMQPEVAAAPADGAIYHDNQNMELFSDARAHRVGDILTIVLVESTQASKKASTSTSKKDKADVAAPTIMGKDLTINGNPLSVGLDSERNFDGSGSSSQSNQLTGQITVTVAQRLSNGNLIVRGEKWLTINQGQELVRIAGIVRPQDIGQDNTVASTRVADARISYTGRGTLADANTRGWLSRFFNSKWMPF